MPSRKGWEILLWEMGSYSGNLFIKFFIRQGCRWKKRSPDVLCDGRASGLLYSISFLANRLCRILILFYIFIILFLLCACWGYPDRYLLLQISRLFFLLILKIKFILFIIRQLYGILLLENRVFAEKRVLVRENESISLFLSLASCKLYHIKSVCQERETN